MLAEMTCPNPACKLHNEIVDVRYLPETRDDPAEWYDDPECKACLAELTEVAG